MKRRDNAPRDKADQLDRALDAMMRGDHAGIDELPRDMAATVDRLMWLSREADSDNAAGFGNSADLPLTAKPNRSRPASPAGGSIAPMAPVSRRTTKAAALPVEETPVAPDIRPSSRSMPVIMRVAAMLLVIALAGGAVYGLMPLLNDSGSQYGGVPGTDDLHVIQLQPGRCVAEPLSRESALDQLRSVDADRDEAIRLAMRFSQQEIDPSLVTDLNELFVSWQSCRRFGRTYEAMSMQSPYFLREDFYGETALDFRGPVETAYSDATLNEMLDRREELDATSRRYWETIGYYPEWAETLQLAGETFRSHDGSYVAVRAVYHDVMEDDWKETTTVVVFYVQDGDYVLFDILSLPPDAVPYRWEKPQPPS